MRKIKFVSLSKPSKSINESSNLFTGEFGGKSFRDCDLVFGPDGTRYVPKDICALVDSAIDIIDGLNYGLMSGYIASLPIVYTFQVGTMATDASHIFINPGFVLELLKMCGNNPIGIGFVITHEVYHVLFKHHERAAAHPERFTDHRRENMAMDYEINWVIEHSYPLEDDDDPDSQYNPDGSRVQIFDGITKRCNGCIDPKFAGMLWEDIYDQLDGADDYQDPKEENNQEVVYSKDFQDGFRDGCEKAIRELRAQGLVECSIPNVQCGMMMLLEASQAVAQGTYDDGFEEGYKRTMDAVMQALGQGQQSGGSNQMQMPPEAPIPNLPNITLKNPPARVPSSQKQQQNANINKPNITNSSSSSQSKQDQDDNQNKQSGQGDGQGGQSDQQDVRDNNLGGQSTQGDQEQGDNQQGAQGPQSSSQGLGQQQGQQAQGNQGQGSQGVGQDDTSSSTKNIGQGQDMGNLTVIGVTKGYSGKEDSTKGSHILSADDGAKIAEDAGYNDGSDSSTFIGKDNKFSDLESVKSTLRKLGQIMDNSAIGRNGTVIGSSGKPGSGMMGQIGGIINDIYTPDVNWKKLLKRYLKGFKTHIEDIGYNKKHIIYGRYNRIKDKEGESAKRLLVCVDTSGSVVSSGDYLRRIVANVAEIVTKLGVKYIDVIQFAGDVYKDTEFRGTTPPPADKFAIEVETGGTDYDALFDYIQSRYLDHRKSFQAAVIFTDMDVSYYVNGNSPYFSKNKPPYAKKTVWMILNDNPQSSEQLGRKLFGKSIFVSPKDFDKNLNFVQDEKTGDKNIEESLSYVPKCMNRYILQHLNEGNPFGTIKKKKPSVSNISVNSLDNGNDSTPAPKRFKPLGISSRKALDVFNPEDEYHFDKPQTYELIYEWLDSKINVGAAKNKYSEVYLFASKAAMQKNEYRFKNGNSRYAYIHPKTGEIVFYGDLILYSKALELPDFIKFATVHGDLIIGNNTKITELPTGLPAIVNGDVNIVGCPKITSLVNGPIKADKYIVTACRNLKSLDGAPEKCDLFFSDKFTQNDYINYLADTYGIHENLVFKRKKFLNEAFNSTKLTALANNPLNRDALQAMRNIKIMWSEIPDAIVNPIYNNVAKSLAKRRDDNKSGEFGIYIWCDKDDKIWLIGTGNNKLNKEMPDADYSKGKGWLYIAPGFFDILKQRIALVRYINDMKVNVAYLPQNMNINDMQKQCLDLGIKYDNDTIYKVAAKGFVHDQSELTFYHLLLVPDLCCHAYLIQGTKDPKLDKDDPVAHFSYKNSLAIRSALNKKRANAIKDIIVQGRNLNPNDPAYKKYFENYYMTDQRILDKFMRVRNLTSMISLITDEIQAVETMRIDMRKRLRNINATSGSFDISDMLYKKFCDQPVQVFTTSARDSIDTLREVIKKRNELDSRDFERIDSDMQRMFQKVLKDTPLDCNEYSSQYLSPIGATYNEDTTVYTFTVIWASLYTQIVTSMAELNAVVDKINDGSYSLDEFSKYIMYSLHDMTKYLDVVNNRRRAY